MGKVRPLLFFTVLLCPVLTFAQSHSATLSWTPAQQSSGITITSWNVLRGAANGEPYTQLSNVPVGTTSYTDSSVSSGQDYYYVVQAVDSAGATSVDSNQAEAVIPTSPPPLAVATTSLPAATAGISYSVTITASGGTAPYAWSGAGVDGLTFSGTGLLSGTPLQAGTFTQIVTVKDSTGATASASLALSVSATLVVSTTQLPAATAGTSYTVTITASGGTAPYTWSGAGVDGLTLSGTGLLSGMPTQVGTFTQTVTLKDLTGATASASLTLNVAAQPQPLAVATTSLPPTTAGTSYSVTITASGGTAPYTWSGTGVDGLTFTSTGLLSGTPSAAGTFTQSVTVKDSVEAAANASLQLSVSPAPTRLAVATTSLPPATAGTSYSAKITPSGGTAPYTWSGTGVDGLTFSASGILSGVPTQAGTFTQAVTVTDSTAATASASLTLSVTGNPSTTTPINTDVNLSKDANVASADISSPAFVTTADNELLLAFIATDSNGGTNTTVTGVNGGGLSWTVVVRANGRLGTSEIWRAFAPSVLSSSTVTATLSQSVVSSMTVMSFSGVNTSGTNGSGAIGATKAGSAVGAPTATLTTTRNNSWVFGVGNDYDNPIARTPATGQSLVHQGLSSTGDTYWVQMQNAPTPTSGTSVSINDTAPAGDQYNLAVVDVLPAGIPATYSISGTVSGAAVSGVTFILSGASTASTVTDVSGNYTFAGLSNSSYTVTPSKAGFSFAPPSQSATVNNASLPGVNFTAAIPTYSISGTVSGAVVSGVTFILSGASTASTVTDVSGNYTFAGLSNDSYTVTTSKPGFTFTPANQPETINSANVPGVNFTSKAFVAPRTLVITAKFSTNGTKASTIASPQFSTNSANQLLLAFISTDYLSGLNTTVTGMNGGGLIWELVARTNAQSGTSEIWRAFAPSTLSSVTVTASLSQSVVSSMTVVSFSGVDTSGTNGSGAIGATMSAHSARGAPSATLVTTRNNSWIFGVGNDFDNAIVRTPGTVQSLVHEDLSSTGDTYWVQMQNAPTSLSGTSVTINDAAPTADQYNLTICEILAAP